MTVYICHQRGGGCGKGSCVMVSALQVVAAAVKAGRLGVGRPIILDDNFSDFWELVSIGEGKHGEIAGGTVQEDEFIILWYRRSRRWCLTERTLSLRMAESLCWQRLWMSVMG